MELPDSVKVIIPNKVLDKIKFLCKEISRVEWSGILFYRVSKGTMRKSIIEITLEDILLMDKGTAGFTEYNWDEDLVEYQMNNIKSLDWIRGHIHSHQSMSVFFSGTDMEELHDNCTNHNIYLSIVVNNYLDIIGKLVYVASPSSYICKDENGKDYNIEIETKDIPPVMLVHNCEIKYARPEIKVSTEFEERLKVVLKKNEIKVKKQEEAYKNKPAQNVHTPGFQLPAKVQNPAIANSWPNTGKSPFPSYDKKKSVDEEERWNPKSFQDSYSDMEEEDANIEVISLEEEFTSYILRLGQVIQLDSPESALEDIEVANLNTNSLIDSILNNFQGMYRTFFKNNEAFDNEKAYIDTANKVVSILNEYVKNEFDFLPAVILALKEFAAKLEMNPNLGKTPVLPISKY